MTPSFKSIHTWGARKSTGADEENGRAAAKRNPRSVTNIFSPFLLCLSLLYLNISFHSSSWFQFLIAAGWLTGCCGLNGWLAGCPSSKVTSARAREGFPDEQQQWRLQCSANVRHQCRECTTSAARLKCTAPVRRTSLPCTSLWTVGRPCPAGRNPMPGNSQPLHRHQPASPFCLFMRSESWCKAHMGWVSN